MTLYETEKLLNKHSIPYRLCQFENEGEFLCHVVLYPKTKYAKSCKVIAIVIDSPNACKNIEIQFNVIDDIPQFYELWFGEYTYEMFDWEKELVAEALIEEITTIMRGNFKVIVVNSLTKRQWLSDKCYDLDDDDYLFGNPGFQRAMQKIQKPKTLLAKRLKSKRQYEIYDWNSYQCIIK